MNNDSRIKNSMVNSLSAIINQVVLIILTFISKTIFIKTLGVEYLGLSGLYSNIITIFSLAELGLSTSIVYSLYKPIAEHDTKKVNSLIVFYSRIYKFIAIIILIVGLALIPFLNFVVKTTIPLNQCMIYYILFLLDAVFSYLFIYKILLLNADQRNYVVTSINTLIIVIKSILQIIILLYSKNYVLFLIIQIISTLTNNLILSNIANKKYPFIKEKSYSLDKNERNNIVNTIKSQCIYKFSNVLLNGTDNILISVLISTECVGYYSNYNVVVATVNTLITILFTAVTGSLGNFIVRESEEKIKEMFDVFNFVGNYLAVLCNLLLLFLLNDFITLWLGESFVLGNDVLISIVLNFYLACVLQSITVFRNTTGIFNETKYIMPIAASFNLILSIIFGKIYGVSGIIFASFLSRLITNFWYEPKVLFKKYPCLQTKSYFIKQMGGFLLFVSLVIVNYVVVNNRFSITWSSFLLKAIVIFVITNVILIIINKDNKEFKFLKDIILGRLICKRKK